MCDCPAVNADASCEPMGANDDGSDEGYNSDDP
jgi:hypothetical protein